MLLVASAVLVTFLGLSGSAAAYDHDSATFVRLHAVARSPTTIEVSWAAPRKFSVREWIISVSPSTDQRAVVSFTKLPPHSNRLTVTSLSPNTTYYVFFNAIKAINKEYISLRSEPLHVTTFARDNSHEGTSFRTIRETKAGSPNESSDSVTTTPSTSVKDTTKSILNSITKGSDGWTVSESTTEAQHGSRAKEVAAQQRKGMVKWVLICVGAGLGLILLLTALTFLTYLPWRQRNITMRKKKKESSTEKIPTDNDDRETPDTPPGSSPQQTQDHRGLAINRGGPHRAPIPDLLPPNPHRSAQNAHSVISWGSEFDILDDENVYNNTRDLNVTSPVLPSSSPPALEQPALPPPRIAARTGGVRSMVSKLRNNLSNRLSNHFPRYSSGRSTGASRSNLNFSAEDADVQTSNQSTDCGYVSGSSTYENNFASSGFGETDDAEESVYINDLELTSEPEIYVNSGVAVPR